MVGTDDTSGPAMVGAAEMLNEEALVDDDGVLAVADVVPKEKKSTGAASALLDGEPVTAAVSSSFAAPCHSLVGELDFVCETRPVLEGLVVPAPAVAEEADDLLVVGFVEDLSPSIALNASLFLPLACLEVDSVDLSSNIDSSGDTLRAMCKGASAIAGASPSSAALAALLTSASLFLSAKISSSLRFGAGSIPKSIAIVELLGASG